MKCAVCGTAMDRNRVWTRPYLSWVILTGESDQCVVCATGVPDVAGQLEVELKHTIARALVYKPARLEAWEIRFLRSDIMGLNSRQFARYMGAWSTAVSRWESENAPQEMGEAADRLLRLLVVAKSRLTVASADFLTRLPSKEGQMSDPEDRVERPTKPPHIVCALVEDRWVPEWWSGNRRVWVGREGKVDSSDRTGVIEPEVPKRRTKGLKRLRRS